MRKILFFLLILLSISSVNALMVYHACPDLSTDITDNTLYDLPAGTVCHVLPLSEADTVFNIASDNVYLDLNNIVLYSDATSMIWGSAVLDNGFNGFTLKNFDFNRFEDSIRFNSDLGEASDINIFHGVSYSLDMGINDYGTVNNLTVNDINFFNAGDLIQLVAGNNVYIYNNNFFDGRYSFNGGDINGLIFINNSCINFLSGGIAFYGNASNVFIANNSFSGHISVLMANTGVDIENDFDDNVLIFNNNFSNSKNGLYLNSNSITVKNNSFHDLKNAIENKGFLNFYSNNDFNNLDYGFLLTLNECGRACPPEIPNYNVFILNNTFNNINESAIYQQRTTLPYYNSYADVLISGNDFNNLLNADYGFIDFSNANYDYNLNILNNSFLNANSSIVFNNINDSFIKSNVFSCFDLESCKFILISNSSNDYAFNNYFNDLTPSVQVFNVDERSSDIFANIEPPDYFNLNILGVLGVGGNYYKSYSDTCTPDANNVFCLEPYVQDSITDYYPLVKTIPPCIVLMTLNNNVLITNNLTVPVALSLFSSCDANSMTLKQNDNNFSYSTPFLNDFNFSFSNYGNNSLTINIITNCNEKCAATESIGIEQHINSSDLNPANFPAFTYDFIFNILYACVLCASLIALVLILKYVDIKK